MADVIKVSEGSFSPPVKPGQYPAVIESYTRGTGGFGNYLKFNFKIISPEAEGIIKTYLTSAKITKSEAKPSKLYSMISALGIEIGENFDLEKLLGTECSILVQNDKVVDGQQYQKITAILPA